MQFYLNHSRVAICRNWQANSKIYIEIQETQPKIIWKTKLEDLHQLWINCDMKINYKSIVIKTADIAIRVDM